MRGEPKKKTTANGLRSETGRQPMRGEIKNTAGDILPMCTSPK